MKPTLENTVTAMVKDTILSYPSLYDVKHQGAALIHFLTSFGAGYGWTPAGQLGCIYPSGGTKHAQEHFAKALADAIADQERRGTGDRSLEIEYLRKMHDYEFVCAYIDELVTENSWKHAFKPLIVVSMSESSPIFNLPDNIQVDWLLAAREVAQYARPDTAYEKFWAERKPALDDRIDELMVKNGFASREQQRENAKAITALWATLTKK